MRIAALISVLAFAGLAVVEGQAPIDAKLQGQLKQLFPAATSFSPRGGDPPHFKAFTGGKGGQP